MSSGWFYLAAMIAAYGVANLLQSHAATRTTEHASLHPKLLLRLAGHRTYVLGIGCQILGFVLAFFARKDLPLFLVQASVAAGLGVTVVLGVLFVHWRLPRAEIALLGVLFGGVAALVFAAAPAPSLPGGPLLTVGLVAALAGIALAGAFAARMRGVPASVVLGSLAGLNFGAAAIASRPLANVGALATFASDPLLYLLVAHSLVGQLLLALAMQRGSTTAAVAAMDAATAVPAAIVGLTLLGDKIVPGRGWIAVIGFLATLGAVAGITRFAEPQPQRRRASVLVPAQRSSTPLTTSGGHRQYRA